MTNLTEDIRTDLTKLFSTREETVTEETVTEHEADDALIDYAQEISAYFVDLGTNFDDERANDLADKMDAITSFLQANK